MAWRCNGHRFDSQSGCFCVASTWTGDYLQTGKVINTKANSAFQPSGVGKLSTGLSGWGKCKACSPVSVAGNTFYMVYGR